MAVVSTFTRELSFPHHVHFSQWPSEAGIAHLLRVQKLKLREVELLAKGHPVKKEHFPCKFLGFNRAEIRVKSGRRDSNLRQKELINGRKYLQVIHLIKDLDPEDTKNAYNSIIKRQITQLQIGQRIWIAILQKIYTMAKVWIISQ